MKPTSSSPTKAFFTRALLALLAVQLSGCTTPAAIQSVRDNSNPTDRAQKSITNFTPALRCMDDMMFERGTRDVTLMMEEFRDATFRVPVSGRDMMTSAISDMTRRSRAVRLSLFGSDQQNLTQLLFQAQKTNAFGVIPQYNIRGTISQFDDTVNKSGGSVGFNLIESLFGVRASAETRFSVMGLDAAVVDTSTLTLIPGVSSKNTTVLASRDASAADGQARLENPSIGLVFSFATARSDGPAQAARNMLELATVELVGKLIRAPYWQCLGVPDSDKEVQREMEDWFLSMDASERVSFIKDRMREKRYFNGALDGAVTPEYEAALQNYRQALKLPAKGQDDLTFFKAFITQTVPKGKPDTTTVTSTQGASQAFPDKPVVLVPAALHLSAPNLTAKSTTLNLRVETAQAGYMYCYMQDRSTQRLQRIFPNRFAKDPRVEAGSTITLPGKNKFTLKTTADYACIHAPREIYGDLPPPLRWGDFEDIKAKGFDEIRDMFAQASGATVQLAFLAR
jgi:hypothetical protein